MPNPNVLPQLTWNMGEIFFEAEAAAESGSVLQHLSGVFHSSSYWKVVQFANSASVHYPSLIVAPQSTSASYTHMRMAFVVGDAQGQTNGPHADDLAANVGSTNNSEAQFLWVGIAPFAGGDWRNGQGGSKIWPTVAQFSGWHPVSSRSTAGRVGARYVYLLENEEWFILRTDYYGWQKLDSNIVGLCAAGAMFVAHSTSSCHADRFFGLQGGSVNSDADQYQPFYKGQNPFGYESMNAPQYFWPAAIAASSTQGSRHYGFHSASTSWIQMSTAKGQENINASFERNCTEANPTRDAEGRHILRPMFISAFASPYTGYGYWRQMTVTAACFDRMEMRDSAGNTKGFTLQKVTMGIDPEPGYLVHNDLTTT